ncbi:uncharacterized protein LOC126330797 [Schistocerca gregaria]|uniref:uncharacterized protein LOC126330797 n=1 Tax=Schistocerca gregaria TaxID=7010 RepID=UPI00211DF574|nr:uncharacterized protein LOC126330797 [Schistocerca gregaria]
MDDPSALNHLVVTLLTNVDLMINSLVDSKKKEFNLDHNNKHWIAIKPPVYAFFFHLLHFFKQILEPEMKTFILKSLEKILKYMLPFKKLQKLYLKRMLQIWSDPTTPDKPRILAFLILCRMLVQFPYPFINKCLKGIYIYYINTAKFVSEKTLAVDAFMRNCIVEVYSVDFVSSYQHAFVYIRELAQQLRKAYQTHTRDRYKAIYSFQYLHSIKVWVQLVTKFPTQKELGLLCYPLIQLLHGMICLNTIPAYFPMRLHCVELLNHLANASKVFTNGSFYLLEILSSKELLDKPKPSMAKQFSLKYHIKVPPNIFATRIYQNTIFEQTIFLLTEYLAIFSSSIAFPELCVFVLSSLRKFRKKCSNPIFCKQVKLLLTKIELTVKLIQAKRAQLEFSPDQLASIPKYLCDNNTPLYLYYQDLARSRSKEQDLLSNRSSNVAETPSITDTAKSHPSRSRLGKDSNVTGNPSTVDTVKPRPSLNRARKKTLSMRLVSRVRKHNNSNEDIVQDTNDTLLDTKQ